MSFHLTPELEARLVLLAKSRRCEPEAVLDELLAAAESEQAAEASLKRAMVRAGRQQIEAGESIAHEDVVAEIDAILAKHAAPLAVWHGRQSRG